MLRFESSIDILEEKHFKESATDLALHLVSFIIF